MPLIWFRASTCVWVKVGGFNLYLRLPGTRTTSPGLIVARTALQAAMCGSRSVRRLDFARKMIRAIFLSRRFCSYSKPWSAVSKTSNLADSAAFNSSPFFSPAKPAYRAVWQSCSGKEFRRRSSRHSSMRIRIYARADKSSFASSKAAMAIPRETVGKPSRNSSRVSPPSK